MTGANHANANFTCRGYFGYYIQISMMMSLSDDVTEARGRNMVSGVFMNNSTQYCYDVIERSLP